ncbi:MAG: hypothetical protein KAT16_04040 [Candidatus Heimdallarchaeota archaeon]|nr:hypothetical protein [Candidatus Heimdallarchaeota archaeon]
MGIRKIDIDLSISNKNPEEAKIIHETLSPDNLTTPPMSISSRWVDSRVEIKIKNVQNIDTAIATVNDLLESYGLSKDILERLNKEI